MKNIGTRFAPVAVATVGSATVAVARAGHWFNPGGMLQVIPDNRLRVTNRNSVATVTRDDKGLPLDFNDPILQSYRKDYEYELKYPERALPYLHSPKTAVGFLRKALPYVSGSCTGGGTSDIYVNGNENLAGAIELDRRWVHRVGLAKIGIHLPHDEAYLGKFKVETLYMMDEKKYTPGIVAVSGSLKEPLLLHTTGGIGQKNVSVPASDVGYRCKESYLKYGAGGEVVKDLEKFLNHPQNIELAKEVLFTPFNPESIMPELRKYPFFDEGSFRNEFQQGNIYTIRGFLDTMNPPRAEDAIIAAAAEDIAHIFKNLDINTTLDKYRQQFEVLQQKHGIIKKLMAIIDT